MDDNYTGNGSNNVNGFQINKYILDTCSAYNGYIQNRVIIINNTVKTPYELWKGRPTNVKHFRVFGRKWYIKREDGRMRKFDSRLEKGVLIGYSRTRK